MAKSKPFPTPSMRYVSGAWVILWRYTLAPGDCKQYTVSTGLIDKKKDEAYAEIILRDFAVALAKTPPEFPVRFEGTAGVKKYISDRFGIRDAADNPGTPADPKAWLPDYEPLAKKELEKHWAHNSLSFLSRLDAFIPGGIGEATPALANKFLEHLQKEGASNGTRNRALAACSRFFRWCIRSERVTGKNPFRGIKQLKEPKKGDIVYCTREERARVLDAAKASGRMDWMAVAIAFYAGCRREEIYRLDWKDVNFVSGRISIRVTKTDAPRTIPIAAELLTLLQAREKKRGHVVERPAKGTWENHADRLIEIVRERVSCPENPGLDGKPWESIGKRRFLMTEDALEGREERAGTAREGMGGKPKGMKARNYLRETMRVAGLLGCPDQAWDGQEWIPGERIGWNTFRHTFGSLLAQSGVSLDKICSWMGNTPEVCKRHYTQFVPRGGHDEDIDKL